MLGRGAGFGRILGTGAFLDKADTANGWAARRGPAVWRGIPGGIGWSAITRSHTPIGCYIVLIMQMNKAIGRPVCLC